MENRGFGKRGLVEATAQADEMQRRREAFIASERARAAQGGIEPATQAISQPSPRPIAQPAPRIAQPSGQAPARPAYAPSDAAQRAHIASYPASTSKKSMLLAYVLWYFAGIFAAHRFYLGAWRSACWQAGLFFGGLVLVLTASATDIDLPGFVGVAGMIFAMLWMLFDVFLIPGLARKANTPPPFGSPEHAFA